MLGRISVEILDESRTTSAFAAPEHASAPTPAAASKKVLRGRFESCSMMNSKTELCVVGQCITLESEGRCSCRGRSIIVLFDGPLDAPVRCGRIWIDIVFGGLR